MLLNATGRATPHARLQQPTTKVRLCARRQRHQCAHPGYEHVRLFRQPSWKRSAGPFATCLVPKPDSVLEALNWTEYDSDITQAVKVCHCNDRKTTSNARSNIHAHVSHPNHAACSSTNSLMIASGLIMRLQTAQPRAFLRREAPRSIGVRSPLLAAPGILHRCVPG